MDPRPALPSQPFLHTLRLPLLAQSGTANGDRQPQLGGMSDHRATDGGRLPAPAHPAMIGPGIPAQLSPPLPGAREMSGGNSGSGDHVLCQTDRDCPERATCVGVRLEPGLKYCQCHDSLGPCSTLIDTSCASEADCDSVTSHCESGNCFCMDSGVKCKNTKTTSVGTTTSPTNKQTAQNATPASVSSQQTTVKVATHAPCSPLCPINTRCHVGVCICNNNGQPQVNGSCLERTSTPSDVTTKSGVILSHQFPHSPPAVHDNTRAILLQTLLPVSFIVIFAFIISFICIRRQRQRRHSSNRNAEAVAKSGDGVMLLDRMNNINKNPTYFVSPGEDVNVRKFMVKEICMSHIVLVDVVGEGAFGQVYRGELHCPETNTQQLVAVKVLKENVSNEIREDFEREVEIMSAFDHDNILKLVGVVTQNAGQSPYMIFEYMVHGDLAELLRKNDPILNKKDLELDVIKLQKPDLVDIATQIANGMRYLTSQHFVHRDLATRNCLVGDGLVVKISDFGMSRDIYTCDYYKIGGSRMLPVRWMSPESVKYGKFTSESDAWAYGVVLWEIFSCGKQPYYGHSNEEVVRFLDAGILLQRPEDCPSTVYHIMLGCWKADPKERLSFDKIHKHLQDYHQRLVKLSSTPAASQSPLPTTPPSEVDPTLSLQAQVSASSSPDLQLKRPQAPQQQQQQQQQQPQQQPASQTSAAATTPVKLLGPRAKPLLKATQSDPHQVRSKVFDGLSQALSEGVRPSSTSSQSLTQHRVQPAPPALQPRPQDMGDDPRDDDPHSAPRDRASEVAFQVKLPPQMPPMPQSGGPVFSLSSAKSSSAKGSSSSESPGNRRKPGDHQQQQSVEVRIVDTSTGSPARGLTTPSPPKGRRYVGSFEKRMRPTTSGKDGSGFDSGFSSAEQQWSDIDMARGTNPDSFSAEADVEVKRSETTPLTQGLLHNDEEEYDDDDFPLPPPPCTEAFLSSVVCTSPEVV